MQLHLLFRAHYSLLAAVLISVAIAGTCSAQQKGADSLLNNLKNHPKEDTTRLSLIIKLAFAYSEKDFYNGVKYADLAIASAKQLNQKHLLAEAYLAKGRSYEYNSEPKKGLDTNLFALNIYSRLKDKPGIIKCCFTIAKDYYTIANYVTGLGYAKKAVYLSQQIGNKRLLVLSLASLGVNYTWLADYPEAITCYFKELRLVEELNDKSNIAKALGNIGLIYYCLKRYPEALEYYNKCLKTLEELDDKLWVAAALNNIGSVYLETSDYLKAIAYNKKAFDINQLLNSKKGMANDLMDMGAAYSHLNNYNDAFDCLGKAIDLYDKLGAKNNSAIALGDMASLYCTAPAYFLLKQHISPASRYSKALQLELKAVELAHQVKSQNNEADQWKKLSLIYEKQSNYKGALVSYRNYNTLSDSIFNDKKRQEITRMGMQYNFDKREAVLKTQNAEKQAKAEVELAKQKIIKNASILIGLILLLASVISFAFYNRRKDAKERQKEAEFKVHTAETELKALRSQLNPHFIFNSLNSIGDYVARHDKVTADIYLTKFARLMRMILENSENETVSLADDIKTLELYMQLEALRLGHKFLYEIHIDEQIDAENTLVPPMILQPFVENSIWHGISPKNGDGKIIISVTKQGEMIDYEVEDNGIGRNKAKLSGSIKNGGHKKSFGIKVIQSRIDILNIITQTNAKIDMTDLDEGTRVSIKLPLNLKF